MGKGLLLVAFALCFPTTAFSQSQAGLMLKDVLDKEFVVEDFIEKALDPAEQIYEPEEYVTQEFSKSETAPNLQNNSFKPLSELTADQESTFDMLVKDAAEDRSHYLANPSTPTSSLAVGSLEEPATPLNVVQNNNPNIPHPQELSVPSAPNMSIIISKDGITPSMKEINLSVGEKFSIAIQKTEKSELGFFIRDQGAVAWSQADKVLTAQKEGYAELLLTSGSKLAIVPIHVGKREENLQVPREFVVLSDLGPSKNLSGDIEETFAKDSKRRDSKGLKKRQVIEHPSSALTDSYTFALEATPFEIQTVEFRVVDEHSSETQINYILGAELNIVGSEKTMKTDALGRVSGLDVPKNSSFIVSVKDPQQRYRSTTVEISASQVNSGQPITIRLMDQRKFNSYLQLANTELRAGKGSICATVQTPDGKRMSGVSLTTDREKSRPQYFDRYGYLNPSATQTSENGRFCIFDLDSEPLSLSFLQNGVAKEQDIPLNIFPDSHLEHVFVIGETADVSTSLAAAPTAFEVLNGGQIIEKEYRAIDYTSLLSFGLNKEWEYDSDSTSMHSRLSIHDGRAYYLVNSPEFERTLYCINISEDKTVDTVTPLFPSRFLSMLANEYRIDTSSLDTGTVLVDHGTFEGHDELSRSVEISLLDKDSKPVGTKVTLMTQSGSSTIFYNVEPGTYSVIVKSTNGDGLAYDTVLVYSETLSYKHTGSPRYRYDSDENSSELASE